MELLKRCEGNPILVPGHWPYPVNAVFNPGAVEFGGEVLLLVRVEDFRGFSHLTVAKSPDGYANWTISPEPTLSPDPGYAEERWGLEDPRIVWLPEREEYAITCVSFSKGGPVVSLITTRDFREFTRHGALVPPEDKDASLFPRTFRGRYALIHRPIIRGEAHIWISFSPDLRYWGEHRVLLPVRPGWWDCHRVGLGPPPIETDEGWLLIYHGVRVTASGSLYRVGLALLDLDEPWRVVRRASTWIFGPREDYEFRGDVPGVTFPTGVVLRGDKLLIYYGAADKVVCLAEASLRELLDFLRCEG